MKHTLFGLGVVALVLAACADPLSTGSGGSGAPTSFDSSQRVNVYEAMVRYLADPAGSQPIYVVPKLCFSLMRAERTCPDRLDDDEQQELGMRLHDLGDIVFLHDGEPGPSPGALFQEIVLGPIVDKPDGLRVEGGSVCGGICGSGAVYILEATDHGYKVTGTDDTHGRWVA